MLVFISRYVRQCDLSLSSLLTLQQKCCIWKGCTVDYVIYKGRCVGTNPHKNAWVFGKHSKYIIEIQQWVVTAIPAIPSGLRGSGGKQNTDKLQKLVWSTVYPYCEFNSNYYKGGRALQKWCRAVALIPQAAGEVSWQEVAALQPEGQQHNLNVRDRESYWVWVVTILSGINYSSWKSNRH